MTYLACTSDEYLTLESMAIQVCTKITSKLNFLYPKRRFLWKVLRRFLCNSLIPPYFDYAFAAWYPNLNQKYRNKLHVSQNKCIRFCLQLDNRGHIGHCTKNEKILNGKLQFFCGVGTEHLDKTNWFPMDQRPTTMSFHKRF